MTPEQWAHLTPQQQAQHVAVYGPPPPHYAAPSWPPTLVVPPPAKSRRTLWITLGVVGTLLLIGAIAGPRQQPATPTSLTAPSLVAVPTAAPTHAYTTAPAPIAATVPAATVTVPALPAAAVPTTAEAAEAKTVTLPAVAGRNGGIVYDELMTLGLTNLQLASRDRDSKVVLLPANWTAVRIEPAAGTKVRTDQAVVVTMTKH